MMLRSKLESRLEEYVAGDADAAECAAIEALLARDPKARALHDDIRAAHDALQTLRHRPEPPVSADDALPHIQRALAAAAFAGKPPLELRSWSTTFYKRVAVAAVLLCGVSLGLFLHGKLSPAVAPDRATPAVAGVTEPAPGDRSFNLRTAPVDVRGGPISGLDWMNRNNGKLVTFTPTDAVVPLLEADPR